MTRDPPGHPRTKLIGREEECARLDQLLSEAMAQESAATRIESADIFVWKESL